MKYVRSKRRSRAIMLLKSSSKTCDVASVIVMCVVSVETLESGNKHVLMRTEKRRPIDERAKRRLGRADSV